MRAVFKQPGALAKSINITPSQKNLEAIFGANYHVMVLSDEIYMFLPAQSSGTQNFYCPELDNYVVGPVLAVAIDKANRMRGLRNEESDALKIYFALGSL